MSDDAEPVDCCVCCGDEISAYERSRPGILLGFGHRMVDICEMCVEQVCSKRHRHWFEKGITNEGLCDDYAAYLAAADMFIRYWEGDGVPESTLEIVSKMLGGTPEIRIDVGWNVLKLDDIAARRLATPQSHTPPAHQEPTSHRTPPPQPEADAPADPEPSPSPEDQGRSSRDGQ